MPEVDQSILVDAYVRYGQTKGRPALEKIWLQALADTNAGVTVTSVTFEGASGSGVQSKIDTATLLTVVEQALQIIDGTFTSGRSSHMLFGSRILET